MPCTEGVSLKVIKGLLNLQSNLIQKKRSSVFDFTLAEEKRTDYRNKQ